MNRVSLNQAKIAERILINGNCNLVKMELAEKCNQVLKEYLSQTIPEKLEKEDE